MGLGLVGVQIYESYVYNLQIYAVAVCTFFVYLCMDKAGYHTFNQKSYVMCSVAEVLSAMEKTSMESRTEKIMERISRDLICPGCKVECDIDVVSNYIVKYTCSKCGKKRVDLI